MSRTGLKNIMERNKKLELIEGYIQNISRDRYIIIDHADSFKLGYREFRYVVLDKQSNNSYDSNHISELKKEEIEQYISVVHKVQSAVKS